MSLPAAIASDVSLSRLVRRGDAPRHRDGTEGTEAASEALALGLDPLGWGTALDAALPDGGLPRGAVVELASALGLARATSFAAAACASAQRASASWAAPAWCAWVDPWGSLHAPGLRSAGVELEHLLVVRCPVQVLARTALRVAASGAFAVVIVDAAAPLGSAERGSFEDAAFSGEGEVRLDRWPTVVRRLALAVEGSETTILLLTDLTTPRGLPLPVAMRIELDRQLEAQAVSLLTPATSPDLALTSASPRSAMAGWEGPSP